MSKADIDDGWEALLGVSLKAGADQASPAEADSADSAASGSPAETPSVEIPKPPKVAERGESELARMLRRAREADESRRTKEASFVDQRKTQRHKPVAARTPATTAPYPSLKLPGKLTQPFPSVRRADSPPLATESKSPKPGKPSKWSGLGKRGKPTALGKPSESSESKKHVEPTAPVTPGRLAEPPKFGAPPAVEKAQARATPPLQGLPPVDTSAPASTPKRPGPAPSRSPKPSTKSKTVTGVLQQVEPDAPKLDRENSRPITPPPGSTAARVAAARAKRAAAKAARSKPSTVPDPPPLAPTVGGEPAGRDAPVPEQAQAEATGGKRGLAAKLRLGARSLARAALPERKVGTSPAESEPGVEDDPPSSGRLSAPRRVRIGGPPPQVQALADAAKPPSAPLASSDPSEGSYDTSAELAKLIGGHPTGSSVRQSQARRAPVDEEPSDDSLSTLLEAASKSLPDFASERSGKREIPPELAKLSIGSIASDPVVPRPASRPPPARSTQETRTPPPAVSRTPPPALPPIQAKPRAPGIGRDGAFADRGVHATIAARSSESARTLPLPALVPKFEGATPQRSQEPHEIPLGPPAADTPEFSSPEHPARMRETPHALPALVDAPEFANLAGAAESSELPLAFPAVAEAPEYPDTARSAEAYELPHAFPALDDPPEDAFVARSGADPAAVRFPIATPVAVTHVAASESSPAIVAAHAPRVARDLTAWTDRIVIALAALTLGIAGVAVMYATRKPVQASAPASELVDAEP